MTSESIRFRQRLAEALSRGGLNERAVMAEVLMLLPEQFLTQYELLYLATWKGSSGAVRIGDEFAEVPVALKWRTSSSQVETRGTASPKGSGGIGKGLGVKSVRAEATKQWVDRQLRKLAREIAARLDDEDTPMRRCAGVKCRRIAESRWNYCPYCGAPTEEDEGE